MLYYKMNNQSTQTQKWNADKQLGNYGENIVINYLNNLEQYKDNQFKLFKYQYNTFDLRNNDIVAEVKSRRNKYSKYPTTMVGMNKIKEAISNHDNFTYDFYFLFTDGLYRWRFWDKDDEESMPYSIGDGGRTDRGYNEIKKYAYIKIEHLELITTEIKSFS